MATEQLIDWKGIGTAAGALLVAVGIWIKNKTGNGNAGKQTMPDITPEARERIEKLEKDIGRKLTAADLVAHCTKEHQGLENVLASEIRHLRELMEEKLGHGEKNFDALNSTMKIHSESLANLGADVRILKESVNALTREIRNGGSKKVDKA